MVESEKCNEMFSKLHNKTWNIRLAKGQQISQKLLHCDISKVQQGDGGTIADDAMILLSDVKFWML